MSESSHIKSQRRIEFLYTNIGRGHPYYLDGIKEALVRLGSIGIVRGESDVFERSHFLSRLPWQLARLLYRKGSSENYIGRIYRKVRSNNNYNKRSVMLSVMGLAIKKHYQSSDFPLVVAHPTLAAILRERKNLIYQHGEVVAPGEALVQGIDTVIVPTSEVAEQFDQLKNRPDNIFVSGLCVEPALVAQAEQAFYARLMRLEQELSIMAAIYSSGAEPATHVNLLAKTAIAMVLNSHRVFVFALRDGRLHQTVQELAAQNQLKISLLDGSMDHESDPAIVNLVLFDNRRQEYRLTAKYFSAFDLAIFPAHERSNWSLGLGLPTFVVSPEYGPFAPINREVLIKSGVAKIISGENDIKKLASTLNSAESRKLLTRMAEAGWGKSDIYGFEKIAKFLVDRVDQG